MYIDIDQLHADPRNSNVCSQDILEKLKKSICQLQKYTPLIVRIHPEIPNEFILVDGHHRLIVLKELEHQQVACEVWDMTDEKARLALATLNRLRGMDDYHKRSELIESLVRDMGVDELVTLLPETSSEIEDMLALLKMDEDELEKSIKEKRQAEAESLPIPYTFVIAAEDSAVVNQALEKFQGERSNQFVALCRQSMEGQSNDG